MNGTLITLICICGAGAAVLMGFAVSHYFFKQVPKQDTSMAGSEFDQVRYMREMRLRNLEAIAESHGLGRRWQEVNKFDYSKGPRSTF